MTKRTIWILNFVTTGLMSIGFLVSAGHRIFTEPNDKDAIVISLTLAVIVYLIAVAFTFNNRILKWSNQPQPFYLITLPVTGLSVLILINLGRNWAHDGLSTLVILTATICGLNVATFGWGIISKTE